MQLAQDRELLVHLRRLPFLLVGVHEQDPRRLREWRLLDGAEQLPGRLVESALPHEGGAEIGAAGDVVLVEGNRPAQVRLGLPESALLVQRTAEVIERIGVFRPDDEGATQSRFRFARTPQLDQRESQAPLWFVAIRPEHQRLLEVLDRHHELARSHR